MVRLENRVRRSGVRLYVPGTFKKENRNVKLYRYRAELVDVVDGDTVDLRVDLGFSLYYTVRFRLARIDVTRRTDDRVIKYLDDLLRNSLESIYVQSDKADTYGRWLGEIYIGSFNDDEKFDGYSVNDALVTNRYAKYVHY